MFGSKLKLRLVSVLLLVCMIIPMVPQIGAEDTSLDVSVTVDGEAASEAELEMSSTVKLSASVAGEETYEYAWQIYVEGNWVDIYGATEADLTVNYAMLENALDKKDSAYVRAYVSDANGNSGTSEKIKIHTYEKSDETTEEEPTVPMLKSPSPLMASASLIYSITIEYRVYDENEEGDANLIYQPFTARVSSGLPYSHTETNPDILGYEPKVFNSTTGEYEDSTEVVINIASVDKNYKYIVYYFPKNVEYKVNFFIQNLYDDGYTLADTVTCTGKTGAQTDNASAIAAYLKSKKAENGLVPVYSETIAIAADGSSEVTIELDRKYFYIAFDLGTDGYGTRAVYAKYGTEIIIDSDHVKRSGFVLNGWSVNPNDVAYTYYSAASGKYAAKTLVFTVPAKTATFTASWVRGNTTYYVVYWLENPDDSDYSYLGCKEIAATSGDSVSGSDSYDDSASTNRKKYYYIYNDAMTDKNVTVEGDGSTIVNVYYNRRVFEAWFIASNSRDDGDAVNAESYVTKWLPTHTHTDACKEYLCGEGATLTCGKTEHTHSTACCTLEEHTHDITCYSFSIRIRRNTGGGQDIYNQSAATFTTAATVNANQLTRLGSTDIYYRQQVNQYTYYLKFNNSYYQITQSNNAANASNATATSTLTCTKTVHSHTDGKCVYCSLEEHTHSSDCYTSETEHTHTSACPYRYNCGCSDQFTASDKVVYVIKAKYQQNIASLWPSNDVMVPEYLSKMATWNVYKEDVENDDINKSLCGSNQWTRMVTMEGALCNTSTGVRKLYLWVNTIAEWKTYYVFDEVKFGGKTLTELASTYGITFSYSADGSTVTRTSSGTTYRDWYDPNLKSGYNEPKIMTYITGAKDISHMTKVNMKGTDPDGATVYAVVDNTNKITYLYYNREKFEVSLFNYNNVNPDTVISNVQYGTPYWAISIDGKSLKDYKPEYPDNIEAGAFEFAGWYSTPYCFDGTEIDIENGFVTGPTQFYAKYVPVKHHVTFWLDSTMTDVVTTSNCKDFEDIDSNKLNFRFTSAADYADFYVDHGDDLSTVLPTSITRNDNSDLYLSGWFYDKNGVKTAYYPTVPVTSDMDIYAEWDSETIVHYSVYYKLKKDGAYTNTEIAYSNNGTARAGRSKVFYAKTNVVWYPEYREQWLFPEVSIHTINMYEDEDKNVFTFYYTAADYDIPYVINYLDADTLEPVATSDFGVINTSLERSDMNAQIIHPTYKFVSGYIPDAFQKELIIACTGDSAEDLNVNVLNFYYTKDDESNDTIYDVVFRYQSTDGVSYETTATDNGTIGIGDSLGTEVVNGYVAAGKLGKTTGFKTDEVVITVTYLDGTGATKTDTVTAAQLAAFKAPESGMRITFTYNRKTFNYTINHIRSDNDKYILDESVSHITGTAVYGEKLYAKILDGAKALGYTVIGNEEREYTITTDLTVTFSYTPGLAYLYFYRVSYNPITSVYTLYKSDDDFTGGSLLPHVNVVDLPTGKVEGYTKDPYSVAYPAGDYEFTGWYTIPEKDGALDYANKKLITTDETFNPAVPEGKTIYQNAKYYALFTYNPGVADLTITREGGEGYSFVYHIVGTTTDLYVALNGGESVTVKGLTIGDYTVSEVGEWSWKHNDADKDITLNIDSSKNKLTYNGAEKTFENKWLSTDGSNENVFMKDED